MTDNFRHLPVRECALALIFVLALGGLSASATPTANLCDVNLTVTDTRDGLLPAQYICYGDLDCIVRINHAQATDHGYLAKWQRDLEREGLTQQGGRIRWDIDGGSTNCHAYGCVLSNVPGFNFSMWLNSLGRLGEDQFGEILRKFFDRILEVSLTFAEAPIAAPHIKEGDLVVFLFGGNPKHTGIVEGLDTSDLTKLMIKSKFGIFPVVSAPLQFVADHYHAPEIMVYRRKP